jgi:hypothetical protein
MQASCWTGLVRRIPENQHDKLIVVTTTGVEISIQTFLRAEDDYFVVRGRLAGTTETGRVFFIPYDQMNYLCINSEMPEVQIRTMFGEAPPEPARPAQAAIQTGPASAVAAPAPAPEQTAAPEEPLPADGAAIPAIGETLDPVPKLNSGIRLTLPRKSGLIQRLRARAQVNSVPNPPKPHKP